MAPGDARPRYSQLHQLIHQPPAMTSWGSLGATAMAKMVGLPDLVPYNPLRQNIC